MKLAHSGWSLRWGTGLNDVAEDNALTNSTSMREDEREVITMEASVETVLFKLARRI